MRLKGTLALVAVAASLAGCGDDEGTDAEREYSDTTPATTGPKPPATPPQPPKDSPDQAAARTAVDGYLKAIAAKDAKKVCDSLEKPTKDCERETRRALDELSREEIDGFRRARIESIQVSGKTGTVRTSFLTAKISIPVKKVGKDWKISQTETAPPSQPPTPPKLPGGPETGPGTTPEPPGGIPTIPEASPSD